MSRVQSRWTREPLWLREPLCLNVWTLKPNLRSPKIESVRSTDQQAVTSATNPHLGDPSTPLTAATVSMMGHDARCEALRNGEPVAAENGQGIDTVVLPHVVRVSPTGTEIADRQRD